MRARPLGPKLLEPSDIQAPVEFPNLANAKNAVKLLLLRARLRLDKEPQRATEDFLAAIRIGRRLQSGREPLVGYFVGIAITGMADDAILADLSQMPASVTKRLLAETPEQADLPKRFAETRRIELGDEILWVHFTLVEAEKVLEKGNCPITAALKDHPSPFELRDSIQCLAMLTRAGHDAPFKFKDAKDMVWSLDGHKGAG